ncbi:MAG: guanylate kinase [Candidatus Marinimicrobia bacterium]|jgi:guanylate kinase|nr:guanylate kinase [Candidatus Neomarinimicrobiota bacterium]|tara:strand:- start:113 stop:691 length:579 start_codon:yes stop_codon:yes gene_type:complete
MIKNLITISAPSGSGKTTLCKMLQDARSDISWSVSCTTRAPRPNEINGIDYYFNSRDQFMNYISDDAFAEWEDVHGQYYGTLKLNLDTAIANNTILLLELDVKGSMSIVHLYPEQSFSIFILPPSIDHLRQRLRNRGTDTESRINERLKRFEREMEYKSKFDYVLINEDLEVASRELIEVVNGLKEGVLNGY